LALQTLAIIVPVILIFSLFYRKAMILRSYESNFSYFIRDLTESLRGGLNIVSALENLEKNDYKALNKLIKRLIAEVKIGIPFDVALQNFAQRTGSKLISKMCLTIGQSIKSGGSVADILDAISKSALEIEKIRRERKLHLATLTSNLYVIYFVFLGIVIVLLRFLIPEIVKTSQIKIDINFLKNVIFRNMIIIQGLFIGLNIGNMVEGSIIAGIRHALILIITGMIIWMIFI
jgi:flagellar protein FlaJ